MLKLGIVLNYTSAEKKKDELIPIRGNKYLKATDNQFSILKGSSRYVPADVAIGMYIKYNFPNVIVDFIKPNEVSTRRFKKNDLIFVIIYDLVEAFHLSNTSLFLKFKSALKNSNNVYPPYKYQKFINNKCKYYTYLQKKGIPVAPTYCVTRQKWYLKNPKMYVSNLISKFLHNKWESVIAKPVYGQESIDFAKFKNIESNKDSTFKKLKNYLSVNLPKYKNIVIQEFIKGFDNKNPEFRMYYINGQYEYCIITVDGDVKRPQQEGGTFKISNEKWNYLKTFTKKVVSALPKLEFGNSLINPILLRIDVGSGLDGVKYSYFINEVEFVPSLYIEDQDYPVVENLAEGLLKVAKYYYKNEAIKNPVNTTF